MLAFVTGVNTDARGIYILQKIHASILVIPCILAVVTGASTETGVLHCLFSTYFTCCWLHDFSYLVIDNPSPHLTPPRLFDSSLRSTSPNTPGK